MASINDIVYKQDGVKWYLIPEKNDYGLPQALLMNGKKCVVLHTERSQEYVMVLNSPRSIIRLEHQVLKASLKAGLIKEASISLDKRGKIKWSS